MGIRRVAKQLTVQLNMTMFIKATCFIVMANNKKIVLNFFYKRLSINLN